MCSKFRARHYLTGDPIEIEETGDVISALAPVSNDSSTLPWIAPGLVDIQVNGFAGSLAARRETENRGEKLIGRFSPGLSEG
jgi:N-acetylglucosamine-6-phosphate deacetylase